MKGKRDLPSCSDNHLNEAAFSLGTAIASPNANGFLGAGVDLAGFLADWLVVPEGVLLPVEGLALEELLASTQALEVCGEVVYCPYPEIGPYQVPLRFVSAAI